MARSPIRNTGRPTRRGLAVLSLGVILAASAWSAEREQPKESQGLRAEEASEVSQVSIPPGTPADRSEPGVLQGAVGVFIDEVEPNDTTAAPQALASTPVRVKGNLFRAPFSAGVDVDVYSFTAAAGDRVYAATMTGLSGGSTDTVVDIIDSDGTTILETDDENGTILGSSSAIGGTVLPAAGTYYVRVRQFSITSLTGTIRPYDVYVHVQSGAPTAEVEPNENSGTANPLPANGWVSGVVSPAADSDVFSLTANAGDTIIAILDLDPERDPAVDFNGRLGIGNFNNFFLIATDAGTFDTIPAEALMMTVKTTGTYFIYVQEQVAGTGVPTATYQLSVAVIPARTRTACTTYAGTPGPIGDQPAITDFTIPIPDLRTVDYLRVSLDITHPATADLDVSLISPDGNEVFLFDDPATTAGATAPQINLVLEDEGAIQIAAFGVHSGMHYAPELQGRLAYFKGMQAQGTWTLRVRDDLAANTGAVNSWSLDVCEPEPRPACLIPGPGELTVFTTDFEAGDAGFTHAGTLDEWERGLPASGPITTAHSGVNAWKTDLDATYENSSNSDLISPTLDLTGVTGRVTLNWWQKFQIETASFDTYWVEVRQAGVPGSARKIFEWTGATMTRSLGNPAVTVQQSAGWGLVQADISDFAGTNVEVRFHLETDASVVFPGVAIDDVLVTACETIVGQAISDLGITKDDGQGTYFPGEVLTYTIVASNAGPSTALGATVTDIFPAELTGVSWTCVATAGSSCGSAGGTGNINETINLAPGGTVTYTATATVDPTASGPISNTTDIAVPAGWTDPNSANDSATDTNLLVAAAPEALAVDTAGNGVYQPNETVVVAPTWRNTGAGAVALTGTLTNHTGPVGPVYTIPDGSADYGVIAVGAAASCGSDCYSVANTATARPATHWDSTADETVSPTSATKTWTLHVGDSFTDVTGGGFYRFIETILHNGVTGGCSATTYCPGNSTTREQMAVFVLVSREGTGYTPPACVAGSEAFSDVPATSPFCRWIEELFNRGVVGGCGTGLYCPTNPATREQMAVFVLRTLDPTLNPPACVAGSEQFADVPASSPFCRWIEELANRGVVTGCGGGNYCPTANVSREQMSVFLAVTFGLVLYGL